ncbi:BirA family transcriptional regulator, biotin operon repressor / biotin-[acetyl-CoA-carboxylase] ligase [Cribrihabitans marinus]|uniref:biotin--[biotin carboxyl-carrier protein] ligase n=1 Tax=Cribrihabitans marinus TaxID=1227549 RepID=A0A1H6TR51_9RHOB|nr:biotin--[acetyl-CoA-carboxylase] ligase [Cribrihabitans marinus]GGH21430.1 biotin--[acetyl-CoA-carboxylase] ligase [Cribrihabitans marinus]SEI82521.1 BirA family transcriptional regulator, biotin operon repressor / biotin-[acetyl-CoA-carboxylase] ligase [Cribrihabitans marinus]
MSSWPAGYGLHVLDEVDSTLNEAARIAPTMTGPVWIMARHQTAARGRRGRAWANPRGNLAATLVMRPDGAPEVAALRSFVAALALYDACIAVTGRADGLTLKWPNDVLLNGGKLAGILLESAGRADGVAHLTIGIGVNLAQAPEASTLEPGAVRPVSLLSETGAQVAPDDFLIELAAAFAGYETQFATYGFAPIRRAWLDRAARLGQPIVARTATSETAGTFETVDERGNLVLLTAKGRVNIPAADVYF